MVPEEWYVIAIVCWIAVGLGTGLYLFRRAAPYGRFSNPTWGPMVSNRWGWFIMETTVILTFTAWIPWSRLTPPEAVMVALFCLHYVHRALIYPFAIRTRGKRMPLVIMLSAMVFNTVNGSLLGLWFARWANYPDNWFGSPQFVAGALLFAVGMGLNLRSDYILIHLRKGGDTGYVVPAKGPFKFVSSPNLLGEMVEWGGYALLTWSLPALAFFVWTCANLLPRAAAIHRWYLKTFPDYPPGRKRLIPRLW